MASVSRAISRRITGVKIGLHSLVFLFLGLAGFILDVGYQLASVSLENALARWAIMLALGVMLLLFVAMSEKKGWLLSLRGYVGQVRRWE
jgi:hypothetical protein